MKICIVYIENKFSASIDKQKLREKALRSDCNQNICGIFKQDGRLFTSSLKSDPVKCVKKKNFQQFGGVNVFFLLLLLLLISFYQFKFYSKKYIK